MWRLSEEFKKQIGKRLLQLYPAEDMEKLMARLAIVRSRYAHLIDQMDADSSKWSQNDVILITYGDMVLSDNELPLSTLHRFLKEQLSDTITTVHILPFFPYSSDDGFSVIDYRKVDPKLGNWEIVHDIAGDFKLMSDLVINHISSKSDWFQNYLNGIAPERNYFFEVDPGTDLSQVVRPRSLPLLTSVDTISGVRYVWTTFSPDQVDINFGNPDLLFEMLDIFLSYIEHGARIIRLDAIAYLWKEVGTSCLNLNQTHAVVKLLRDIIDFGAPQVLLLTETNLPHEQNISYFGDTDEAHLVYQFSLPPLLLHAIQTGTTRYLCQWAAALPAPPSGCNYLNFTASHDGIGLRPLEGLMEEEEITALVSKIQQLGGLISTRCDSEGKDHPYEMNITYFDSLGDPERPPDIKLKIARFLCSQAIMLSLQGIPAIYFHSLTGTRNNLEGVEQTGQNRMINRSRWGFDDLVHQLEDGKTVTAKVFRQYQQLLTVRRRRQAFHPDSPQEVLSLEDGLFGLLRIAQNPKNSIFILANLSVRSHTLSREDLVGKHFPNGQVYDLLTEKEYAETITLKPYRTVWLSAVKEDESADG
ncbi:MAG: sugar phosphorylase [Deltaproteobacteria bacterium]|nr:sugar phosphorylase [Deltaproteobacteria bacterium]